MINPFYIKMYLKNPDGPQMVEIMQHFYGLQEQNEYSKIDKILNEVNIRRIDHVIILSLLRCNYPIRQKLVSWELFLAKAKSLLQNTEEEKLLLNLLQKE